MKDVQRCAHCLKMQLIENQLEKMELEDELEEIADAENAEQVKIF